jgi:hypothetical protein
MPMNPGESVTVPAMPLVWTKDTVREMSPARFGMKARLEMFVTGRDLKAGLALYAAANYERFPATPAGWVEAWIRAAAVAGPAPYAKGLASWTARTRGYLGPTRDAAVIAELDARMPPVLYALTFAGGQGGGDHLSPGTAVDLRMARAHIALTASTDGAPLLTIAAAELTGAEASGMGGGGSFAAAASLNPLTNLMHEEAADWMNNRSLGSKDRTFVRIQGTTCELFLLSKSYSPQDAQVALSAVRVLAQGGPVGSQPGAGLLAGLTAPVTPADSGPDDADLVTKLERLAKLRDSGALTQFEFQAAKDKLLH